MIVEPRWASGVCAGLHAAGSRHVVYVPDNPLSHVLRILRESFPDVTTTLATREEEAFGIAAGLYLGGARPTVMLQSSGLGNSLNALTSLLVPYKIPVLIVISMRGDAGEWNDAQVPMGRAVRPICDAMGLPHVTADTPESTAETVRSSARRRSARACRASACCRAGSRCPPHGASMNRLEATRLLVAAIDAEPIIASLGHPAYDLFAAGDRPANFYTWGSMGLASSIGLGLALARPELRIFVVDGDGSLLMNLGSLATIGWTRPANLVLIVWDNQVYGTTGGQDTATAHGADLEAAARAMGATATATVTTGEAFAAAIARSRVEPGPWVIVAKVAESAPTVKPPLDCVFIKQRFMAAIGQPEEATSERYGLPCSRAQAMRRASPHGSATSSARPRRPPARARARRRPCWTPSA